MKYKLILSAAALSLLLPGIAYSQQEQEKEKPQQEERQKTETETHQQTERTQQDTKKQEEETRKQQQDAGKQTQREQKEEGNTEHRQVTTEERKTTEVQRTESNHERGRIPDEKFRASFGREHTFRVERRDDRRFQYGGYWFTYSEPWPVAWAYTDAVYVDFIDGQYYLIDLSHPGVRLLLVVG
jgi:hypothetical protein